MIRRFVRGARLWAGIVGRINPAGYRTGPILALEVARIIHGKGR